MEEMNVVTTGKRPKKDQTSAEDLTIELSEGSEPHVYYSLN